MNNRQEATNWLQKALLTGCQYVACFELVKSNDGVFRVYYQGDATTLYAGGGGYDKISCCIGQVGRLLLKDNILQYDDAFTLDYKLKMDDAVHGGGGSRELVDIIANFIGKANNKKVIGNYYQTKQGYFISFAIIDYL